MSGSGRNEWQVSTGGPRSGGKNTLAKKSTNLSEATSFSALEGADESTAFQNNAARKQPDRLKDRKGSQPLTKAQRRAMEHAEFVKVKKSPGLDRTKVKNGQFVGETLKFHKSEEEMRKEKEAAQTRKAIAAAEKKKQKEKLEKKMLKEKRAAEGPAEPRANEEQAEGQKKSKPRKSNIMTTTDVSKAIDMLKFSNTEEHYKILAVCMDLVAPTRIDKAQQIQDILADWIYGFNDDDVSAFFRVRVEVIATDSPRQDVKISDGERSLYAAIASVKPKVVAKALIDHRAKLGKSRGCMSYAALLMEVLAVYSPSFSYSMDDIL